MITGTQGYMCTCFPIENNANSRLDTELAGERVELSVEQLDEEVDVCETQVEEADVYS